VNPETSAQNAELASLVRPPEKAPTFPVLDRVGDHFARILQEILANLGCAGAQISADGGAIQPLKDWRKPGGGMPGICLFRMSPVKGALAIVVPASLVHQLVDRFYGGIGDLGPERVNFSTSENRFLTRIAQQCSAALCTAWADIVTVEPLLLGVETDWADVALFGDQDPVAVQSFAVNGGSLAPTTISVIYPVDTLRALTQRPKRAEIEQPGPGEMEWRDRLSEAVLNTRLPMRTIFARPELALTRLLTLQPGDIIPICLPQRIPVTVAGRLFAEATVGEASGRIAIQIEKFEQGTDND
jgi:flagellar motor switch protein FliM